MRRVRNQKINSTNPGLMFAAGVEQIISEQLSHPSQFNDRELRNVRTIPHKPAPRENLFKLLLRQFSY
jgi:hypothetical protein